jgi:hypothetical protein
VETAVFWLYVTTLTLLVLHEMDAVHWKEWEMFGVGGGVAGFLLLHLPLWPAAFWGLVEARAGTTAGRVAALVVSAAGLAVFAIHTWFLRRGRPEFRAPLSLAIIGGCLPVSLALAVVTVAAIVAGG